MRALLAAALLLATLPMVPAVHAYPTCQPPNGTGNVENTWVTSANGGCTGVTVFPVLIAACNPPIMIDQSAAGADVFVIFYGRVWCGETVLVYTPALP